MVTEPVVLEGELWPRCEATRFRLYARKGGELTVLAASPTMAGVGAAIGQFDLDCREAGRHFSDEGQVGVLDAVEGRWVVLPWNRSDEGGVV